jgi:hypothetical protein
MKVYGVQEYKNMKDVEKFIPKPRLYFHSLGIMHISCIAEPHSGHWDNIIILSMDDMASNSISKAYTLIDPPK